MSQKKSQQKSWLYFIASVVVSPVIGLIYRVKFRNKNNIPKEGAYIIISNHLSNLDPLLLGMGQRNRKLRFMAKSELFKNKFFAKLITALGAFPVVRGEGIEQEAISTGEEILENGGVMTIFFEGKRSKTGEFLRPRSGAMLIAYTTNTPIVPACITPEKGLMKPFRKTRVTFGDPVTPAELGVTTGNARELRDASKKIMEMLKQMRETEEF
ncbi:MAG: lysophospholipid acyltransferase family protein [Acutalibacteraceae bacterium]|nr:lysophospholipid acyltransferase family protein [Acutalibacteraceae bacterium]